MPRPIPFIMCVCVAFACGGKKKAAPPPKPAPASEQVGKLKATPVPSLGVRVDSPEGWKLEPLGDGKTQVDITNASLKVNLFRRPASLSLAEIQKQPPGSAEEKIELFRVLPDGALWEIAQLPPAGGSPFGWTIDSKRIAGQSELECYALLADAKAKQLYEGAVRAICESLTDTGAGPDAGLDGGK